MQLEVETIGPMKLDVKVNNIYIPSKRIYEIVYNRTEI